jgi:hypothetical protein
MYAMEAQMYAMRVCKRNPCCMLVRCAIGGQRQHHHVGWCRPCIGRGVLAVESRLLVPL